jgi:hypothetical protein
MCGESHSLGVLNQAMESQAHPELEVWQTQQAGPTSSSPPLSVFLLPVLWWPLVFNSRGPWFATLSICFCSEVLFW